MDVLEARARWNHLSFVAELGNLAEHTSSHRSLHNTRDSTRESEPSVENAREKLGRKSVGRKCVCVCGVCVCVGGGGGGKK